MRILIVTIALCTLSKQSDSLTCIGDNGKSVDYFVVYKVPRLENSSDELVRRGSRYAYLDSNSPFKSNWHYSTRSINDTKSAIGATLKAIYKANSQLSLLMYSDQVPAEYNRSTSVGAHAKGVLALDTTKGFWMVHSVPKFPSLKMPYQVPRSSDNNGQIFICITLRTDDSATINNIGNHFLIMRPNVYAFNVTQKMFKKFSFFDSIKKKKWLKNSTSITSIFSDNRVKFTTFSKSRKYEKDIYSQLIAPYFREDMLVQTWRNGAGEKLGSDCKDQFQIINVDSIKLNPSVAWKFTEDHSKWAISSSKRSNQTICVGDINRMRSQFSRGGGSICLQSPNLWSAFNTTIEDVESCRFPKEL